MKRELFVWACRWSIIEKPAGSCNKTHKHTITHTNTHRGLYITEPLSVTQFCWIKRAKERRIVIGIENKRANVLENPFFYITNPLIWSLWSGRPPLSWHIHTSALGLFVRLKGTLVGVQRLCSVRRAALDFEVNYTPVYLLTQNRAPLYLNGKSDRKPTLWPGPVLKQCQDTLLF